MAKSGQGIMPKVDLTNKIKAGKVIETTAGTGGIIYQVWELLKRNAMTTKALTEYLDVKKNTITNAIHHLKKRKNLDIKRYFNTEDGEFYYYLKE